jgi:hypothetical protein
MPDESQPFGLSLDKAVPAEELEEGQIVVLNGYVMEAGPDPDDPDRVRVVIVRALEGRATKPSDRRDIVLSVPADMKLGTGEPFNIELAPPPARS